jgi:ATP adenylyltransferase
MLRRSAEAHASGALYRIQSQPHYVIDHGVEFVVRLAIDFERQVAVMPRNRPGNPFLPPDPPLYLGDVSPTHYALLNKYHVIENHLLVVTREYVDQEVLLDVADFEALIACLPADSPAIGFYNGGSGSGASQPHKHLQVVTLPLSPRAAIPMAPLLAGNAPHLPFTHAFARIDSRTSAALHACYRELLREAGLGALTGHRPERQSHPYNVVIARDWMLLVPRSRERFEGIPLNSLAFAGAFFVRREEQLEAVRRAGPMAILAQAAGA